MQNCDAFLDDEFADTNTQKSTGTVRLHPETVDLVDCWRRDQEALRTKAGNRWTDPNLLVATRWGTAIDQGKHRRSIRELSRKLGFNDLTPYEPRHTAIAHHIEAGHPASVVADWAGTSERMIYKYYRHQLREIVDLSPPELG